MKEEAIKDSIEHWKRNVRRAAEETLTIDHIQAPSCALCSAYYGWNECEECPLSQAGYWCNKEGSPWRKVIKALATGHRCRIVKACRNMLNVLQSLPED